MIDPRADIHPSAHIGENVTIGPWTIVGPDVEIGAHTWVGPHVVIKGPTRIGTHNKIYQFSSIGEDPQDKKYAGESTLLEIGHHNVIREFCTLNRGTLQGGSVTCIGDRNLFMAYVHIAHDSIVGNDIIFANNASLAGHVTVEDFVILSGFSGVHQFCTLGAHSFLAKGTLVAKDVLPFVLISGHEATPCGLNVEGLKRRGFSTDTISHLKRAYKIIYRRGLTVPEAIAELQSLVSECAEIQMMIDRLQLSERGIVR